MRPHDQPLLEAFYVVFTLFYFTFALLLLVGLRRIARSVSNPHLRLFIRAAIAGGLLTPSAFIGEGVAFAPLPVCLIAAPLETWPGFIGRWLIFVMAVLVAVQLVGSTYIALNRPGRRSASREV